ncbi:hypothetical protein AVEN_137620-1 [Araneus ventricosus]|uniref:Uncharacterized protein n=1 Tax=Araneus ventricosus TaxID=182803 RepID=A0A4Y2CV01_ARAVE|nr:hypothetical protein AVEN_137620-1 [Araneus ventricosus]
MAEECESVEEGYGFYPQSVLATSIIQNAHTDVHFSEELLVQVGLVDGEFFRRKTTMGQLPLNVPQEGNLLELSQNSTSSATKVAL